MTGKQRWIALSLLPALVTGCIERPIERHQVRVALVNAGLSAPIARCMAHRLVARLSVGQLRKLQALQGVRPTLDAYLTAAERVDDPYVVREAIGSAGVCATTLTGSPSGRAKDRDQHEYNAE